MKRIVFFILSFVFCLSLVSEAREGNSSYAGTFRRNHSFRFGAQLAIPNLAAGCTSPYAPFKITPNPLAFGPVDVGKTESEKLEFENEDTINYTVEIFKIVSHAPQFKIVNPVTNYCLPPSDKYVFQIDFTPDATGNFKSTIEIEHTNDFGNTIKSFVTVTGSGGGEAVIIPTPSRLSFGQVSVGQSAEQSFTLKNTGSLGEVIKQINSSDSAFQVTSPAFPKSIAEGSSFAVKARFAPTSAKSYSGLLSIVNSAGKTVATVAVDGTGIAGNPDISVSSTRIDFGQVELGTFKDQILNISNTGQGDLQIQSFVFNDPALKTTPRAPVTVGAGRTVPVTVRFRSSSQGSLTRNLAINSNDPDERTVNVALVANVILGKVGFVDKSSTSHIGSNTIRTRGVQWVDYNNDGKLDLYLCGSQGNGLFKNLGNNQFSNVTVTAKAGNGQNNCQGAAWADVDNDGDQDLFIANATGVPVLLKNNKGIFASASGGLGIFASDTAPAPAGGIWLDFNNDGRIDLFVVRKGAPNQLFKSTGLFRFVDIGASAHVNFNGPGVSAVSGDINKDGYQDIYVVNSHAPNKLYVNNKNETFKEIGVSAGVALNGNSRQAVFNDYDGDGDLDLFVVNTGVASILYKNMGNAKFQNVTSLAGLTGPKYGESASFNDIDNDGDEDLILVQSQGGNVLFKNLGSGKFAKVTDVDVSDSTDPTAVSSGDSNNDGQTDTVVGDGGDEPQSNDSLYQNSGGSGNHYLKLILQGTKSNKSAIGAVVVLRAGLLIQAKQVSGGNGPNQESLPLEFGLGTSTTASAVIQWPSGTIQNLQDIAADQTLKITEPVQ
jgi:hypothetical protein